MCGYGLLRYAWPRDIVWAWVAGAWQHHSGAQRQLSALTFHGFMVLILVGRVPGMIMAALLASDAVTSSTAAIVTAAMTIVGVVVLGRA